MDKKIDEIVQKLEMSAHPEGGFYKETYRSSGIVPKDVLRNEFTGDRNFSTAIYFLLTSDNFSAFHRIKQDEIWHYYDGSSLYVHVIDLNGEYKRYSVGMGISQGELPQLVVPAGCWFASSVKEDSNYSLVGCTVSPGFDFDDFELAQRESLIQEYPTHKNVITQFTRS